MERRTCFFIGHRDAPDSLRSALSDSIRRHIVEYGVNEFVVGHYGRFDAMADAAVRTEKQRFPEVTLVLLLPYYPYAYNVSEYDSSYYPAGLENIPKPYAIVRANEHMIRNSEYLICFDPGYVGKTRDYVEFARRRERKGLLHIENLAEHVSRSSVMK